MTHRSNAIVKFQGVGHLLLDAFSIQGGDEGRALFACNKTYRSYPLYSDERLEPSEEITCETCLLQMLSD